MEPLTSDSDGVYICCVHNSQFIEVNSAAVAVVSSSGLSHCQYTGAGGLVQVGGGDEDGAIASDGSQATCWWPNPPSPIECLWWNHSLRDSGSAGEEEGIVGSRVGETSSVGSELQLNGGVCVCILTKYLNNKYICTVSASLSDHLVSKQQKYE